MRRIHYEYLDKKNKEACEFTFNPKMSYLGNYIDGVNPIEIEEWFNKYLDYHMINGFTNN